MGSRARNQQRSVRIQSAEKCRSHQVCKQKRQGGQAMKFKYTVMFALLLVSSNVGAQRRAGGGGGGGGGARVNREAANTSIRNNQTVNRNVERNGDINRNVNRDIDRDIDV